MLTITHVAMKSRDKVVALPKPWRHNSLFLLMKTDPDDEKQGFLTSEGKFVDRVEAKEIAIASGQVKPEGLLRVVYSEDLWPSSEITQYVTVQKTDEKVALTKRLYINPVEGTHIQYILDTMQEQNYELQYLRSEALIREILQHAHYHGRCIAQEGTEGTLIETNPKFILI